MKKYLILIMAVFFIYGAAAVANAEQPATTLAPEKHTSGDFKYIILDDGTAEITKYSGGSEDLMVPDKLDGLTVTSVGDGAFYYHPSLVTVTIPESVMSMGENPFVNCEKLKDIIVSPDHPYLATIDGALFSKSDKRLICYPAGLIKDSYFIPNGILTIGSSAFSSCTSLTTIVIPESVTSIGDSAFWSCDSLNSINIPESVISIGDSAFVVCSSLTNITIPDSVVRMGTNPFVDCTNLKDIIVSPDHPYLANINGALFSKPDKRLICYPLGINLDSYSIPNGILIIDKWAFADCHSLTTINVPESVTRIGDSAFVGCTSLTSITIPERVTSISKSAFSRCMSLTTIIVPEGVTTIEEGAFSGCSSLASVTIPESITNINNGVFAGCSSLTTITIPDTVTGFGSSAFSGCSSLTNITIPESVTDIGYAAFSGCTSLTTITLPESVTTIGNKAFDKCISLTVTVSKDSYAAQYCKDNQIRYTYPDSLDWLNN